MRRNRVVQIAATALATVALGLSLAPSAQAAESDCASGYFCIWRDTAYKTAGSGTALVRFYQYIPNYGLHKYAGTTYSAANSATSLKNNSSANNTVYIYKETNGNGARYGVAAGGARNNLSTSLAPLNWNDDIESGYFSAWDPNS